jgi:poly [ADP-ribose] polymerase
MAKPEWKEQKYKAGDDVVTSDFPDYEVVEHRIGNQTNTDSNNNKFYSLELQKSSTGKWRVYSNYGRVSDTEYSGVVGVFGPGTESEARAFFEWKFKSKVRPSKGYKEIEFIKAKVGSPGARQVAKKLNESEVPEEKKKKAAKKSGKKLPDVKLHPVVERLVDQWYRDNTHTITSNAAVTITSDGIETPLGILSFSQINKGRTILTDLADAIKNKDKPEIGKLTGHYYSNIPAKLGSKISESDWIDSDQAVIHHTNVLQAMEDALEIGGETLTGTFNQKFHELNADIQFLEKTDPEWKRINDKIQKTRGHNHRGTSSKVVNVLQVRLGADAGRYESCSVSNEDELFHGSRNGNILGITCKGLLIAPPEAPVTGYLFGKGIYLADSSTKSLNYSSGFWGGARNNNCFLFIVKAKLGKQLKMYGTGYDAPQQCKRKGCDSAWGVKGNYLIHNEFIVYTIQQARITHIVEINNR